MLENLEKEHMEWLPPAHTQMKNNQKIDDEHRDRLRPICPMSGSKQQENPKQQGSLVGWANKTNRCGLQPICSFFFSFLFFFHNCPFSYQ